MAKVKSHKKTAFGKAKHSPTLDELLSRFSVGDVDDEHNAANGGRLTGIIGWFWVCDDDGVFAYFNKEDAAFRFRLAEINRVLNG